MIREITFQNFRVLQNANLPLKPFTLLLGPNGSGKSTALQALELLSEPPEARFNGLHFSRVLSKGVAASPATRVHIRYDLSQPAGAKMLLRWEPGTGGSLSPTPPSGEFIPSLKRSRVFSFDASLLAAPVVLQPSMELGTSGQNLAGVLDRMRDEAPENFENLEKELGHWLPEFDRIIFKTPSQGQRAVELRARNGHHSIPAADLSQGTLLALALLTLSHLPDPPPIIGLEEPDRGIHPRLFRDLRDTLYKLCYPDQSGLSRKPVQVIATSHSPYLLSLFKEHPEEVVLAVKRNGTASFEPLAASDHLKEIIEETDLGEAWYTGVLGGVPVDR